MQQVAATASMPDSGLQDARRLSIARNQRVQDFLFHKVTLLFALTVLFALAGILVSLVVSSWPTLQKFGLPFLWTVEWDIINQNFGAAIAIFGTLASASIARLVSWPRAARWIADNARAR